MGNLVGNCQETLQIIEYLSGYDVNLNLEYQRLHNKGLGYKRSPLLTTPFRIYLSTVDRFLFSGGITPEVYRSDLEDPRSILVNQVFNENRLNATLSEVWERGSITGEVALVFSQNTLNGKPITGYKLDYYDKTEFTPEYNGNVLEGLKVLTLREFEGKTYWHKFNLYPDRFETFPLVEYGTEHRVNWDKIKETKANLWGILPSVVIQNKPNAKGRGLSDFDKASVDMAIELAIANLDNAEQHHFFSNPLFLSNDPKETLKSLKQRVQVLFSDEESPITLLQPSAIPDSSFTFKDKLKDALFEHLGISGSADNVPSDTSSITLRLLHSKSIATAENKWDNYVTNGLAPLFGKILIASAIDGQVLGVSKGDPDSYRVNFRRNRSYFPYSPLEKQQASIVAEALINLGVKPEIALKEVYPDMKTEELLEILQGS